MIVLNIFYKSLTNVIVIRRSYALYLIVLPIILFVTASALREVQGPYFLFFYDPSYVYLINSLNLAQFNGYGVGHFDHPGTPVQVIGAVVVRFYHFFNGINTDMVADVLERPESYLSAINRSLVFLNCIALLLLGLFTLKTTKSIMLSILIQLSPFSSTEIFFGLIICTPENFLIFVSLLFIGFVIYYLQKIDLNVKPAYMYIVVISIICGLGLATKISFFPLLIFPLLVLRGFMSKVLFSLMTFIFFLIFVSPGLANFEYFINWISDLALKSGKYGKGEATVVNSVAFFDNMFMIFKKDILFTFSFIMIIAALVSDLKNRANKTMNSIKQSKVLLALLLIFVLQTIAVAKHYSQYYMIPSFMLSVLAITLSVGTFKSSGKENTGTLRPNMILASLGLLIFLWSLFQITSSYFEGDEQRKDAYEMVNFIDSNSAGSLVISSFGSSSRECALAFSSQYAAGQSARYREFISSKSDRKIFYNQWTDRFYSLTNSSQTKQILLGSNDILLQLSHYGNLESFLKTLKSETGVEKVSHEKLFTNKKRETLYRIRIDRN
jgi:hypothetical protein